MDEAKFGHFDARRSDMRAIACCPVRVDALAMYDASDAPRMESPTESKGSSIGVEEAASSEDSEADARRRRGEVSARRRRRARVEDERATLRTKRERCVDGAEATETNGSSGDAERVSRARRFGDAGSRAVGEKEERAGGV